MPDTAVSKLEIYGLKQRVVFSGRIWLAESLKHGEEVMGGGGEKD